MLDQLLAEDDLLDPFGVPLSTDPDEIFAEMVEKAQARWPGWEPLPTSPVTMVMRIQSEISAETRMAAKNRLRSLSLEYHSSMFGIVRSPGAAARSTITVRARDAMGYELPERTTVHVGDVECETTAPLVLAPGVRSGTVAIIAVEAGAAPNGADGDVEVDALDWLDSTAPVTLDAPLALGLDPEEELAFSRRAAEELQLLTRTPILAPNFGIVAKRHPQVAHAWVLDGYDPATRTFGNERMVTTIVAGPAGDELPGEVLAEVRAMQVTLRETTFDPHVITVEHVTINAAVEVQRYAGWDDGIVEESAAGRTGEVLAPVAWLTPPYGLDPGFVPSPSVHQNELVAQVDRAAGVDVVLSVSLDAGDGARTSIALGVGQLPVAGEITVTVRGP